MIIDDQNSCRRITSSNNRPRLIVSLPRSQVRFGLFHAKTIFQHSRVRRFLMRLCVCFPVPALAMRESPLQQQISSQHDVGPCACFKTFGWSAMSSSYLGAAINHTRFTRLEMPPAFYCWVAGWLRAPEPRIMCLNSNLANN